MKISQTLLIIILLSINYLFANPKLLEKAGDSSLKARTSFLANEYLGVSSDALSLEKGMEQARQNALTLISQSFGAEVKTSSTYSNVHKNNTDSTYTFTQTFLSTETHLQFKVRQYYWEKWQESEQQVYKVWALVEFDKNEVRDYWLEYCTNLSREIADLCQNQEDVRKLIINSEMVCQKYSLLQKNANFFEREDFLAVQGQFSKLAEICKTSVSHLKIINQSKRRFSDTLEFKVIWNQKSVAEFPLRYKCEKIDTVFYSNAEGVISVPLSFLVNGRNYSVEYDSRIMREMMGVDFPKLEAIWLSRLELSNYSLKLSSNSGGTITYLDAKLREYLGNLGFGFTTPQRPDYSIEIKYEFKKATTGKVYPGEEKVNLKVGLILKKGKNQVWKYNLPNQQFSELSGYGKSTQSAKENALSMVSLENREELIEYLAEKIKDEIIRD